MEDPGPLTQPLIAAPQSCFGITLKGLKQIFTLPSDMRKQELEKLGGTEGLLRLLQTSQTEGIDPSTVPARIQA